MGVDVVEDVVPHTYSADLRALRQQGIDDNTTIVTFTVKFYYTPEVAASYDNLDIFFENVSFNIFFYYSNYHYRPLHYIIEVPIK